MREARDLTHVARKIVNEAGELPEPLDNRLLGGRELERDQSGLVCGTSEDLGVKAAPRD